MDKVLISGATGFIGQHCIPILTDRGYEVHAVSSRTIEKCSSQINWHKVNLLDLIQIQSLISKVKPMYMLHFAWYVEPGKLTTANENFFWVQASLELLRQFYDQGGRRIVMAGSCFEYDWSYGYCSEFLTPRIPATFYGKCKNGLQYLLESYSEQTGVSSSWGRIFWVYGPHDNPMRLVSSVIISLLKAEPAPCSHGNQIRDYLYVKDVAEAFVDLLESDVQGPVNIGSGCPVSLKDIIVKLGRWFNREHLIKLGAIPSPSNEAPLVVAKVNRLFEEVGWSPKYSLKNGLKATIDWWMSHLSV
jgi:nucleoside-diphosphate-sugar epimerase